MVFVLFISIVSLPILYLTKTLFLLIPFIFYALFFTGGITPIYVLVSKSSNKAAYYKIIIALLFYGVIFILLKYFNITSRAFVKVNYILLPVLSLWFLKEIIKQKIILQKALSYWALLKKLLLKSFSLVVSNFANLMFLYTDIFIISLFIFSTCS